MCRCPIGFAVSEVTGSQESDTIGVVPLYTSCLKTDQKSVSKVSDADTQKAHFATDRVLSHDFWRPRGTRVLSVHSSVVGDRYL